MAVTNIGNLKHYFLLLSLLHIFGTRYWHLSKFGGPELPKILSVSDNKKNQVNHFRHIAGTILKGLSVGETIK